MPIPPGLKRRLRPLAFAARRSRRWVARSLRPDRPWDGHHHAVLRRFEPWAGVSRGRFAHDFLGVRTDPAFRPQVRPDPPGPLRTDYPPPGYDYFELIVVLESVLAPAAASPYRMIELGAGWGPWLVTAHRAMQRSAGRPVELIGVEMVPRHFRWMRQHFRNNGIDPDRHRLIQAAVSDYEGEAVFGDETDVAANFGQRIHRRAAKPPLGGVLDSPHRRHTEPVSCISLRGLLAGLDRVDLLHVDVQGEELRALEHAWSELDRCVGRIVVATHSGRIHRALRRRFAGSGWIPQFDFPMRSRSSTEFGDVHFLDGLLAQINPGASTGSAST